MNTSPTPARLTVGVVLESLEVPAWQLALLKSIQESNSAVIELVITPEYATHHARTRLYRMFQALEDKKRAREPDACATTSAEALLAKVDRLSFPVKGARRLDPPTIELIATKTLDVLVILGELELSPSMGSLARFGVWCFEACNRPFSPANGAMTGFRELLERRPHFLSTLQIQTPAAPGGRTAYQSCSAIDYLSHHVTRNEHLWKCSTFVARALKQCHDMGGKAYLQSLHEAQAQNERSGRSPLLIAFVSYFLWRIRRKFHHRLYRERWILMCGIHERAPKSGAFRKLMPPPGRFWADPHVVKVDGRHNVFFEDASQQSGVGHISLMSDNGDGNFTSPREILRRPYHLSYPFIFKWRDTYFLIPESAENRTIELYRCTRFPDQWVFEHNLKEGISAYDATLVERDGVWWLFANVRETEGASSWDELCIYFADSPLSRDWKPHRQNPVISDVRRARPAGRFFVDSGRLFRPSQDSSLRYGHALNINEVLELNENTYREVISDTIKPDWHRSILAVHSYGRAGELTVIDAINRESRFRSIC